MKMVKVVIKMRCTILHHTMTYTIKNITYHYKIKKKHFNSKMRYYKNWTEQNKTKLNKMKKQNTTIHKNT